MRSRFANLGDFRDVQHIERAAGEAFRSIGMDEIADDAPIAAGAFEHYIARGDAWIMTTDDGSPVAYLLLERVDDVTTFRDVRWNAPYYLRLGWTELPPSEWGPELAKKVESEAAHGLAAWTRVVMHRRTEDRLNGCPR